jgi:hypothetical protein
MNEVPNDHIQTVDTTSVQILSSVQDLVKRVENLAITITALSEMLASHIRANLEINHMIQMSLESSLRYRAIREEMDESRLQKELEQKGLEVDFLGKKVDQLLEENQEADALRLQLQQAKLETEKLTLQIDILKSAKRSTTSEKMSSPMKAEKSLKDRVLEGMIMTTATVLTASVVGGGLAFIYFLFRLYITSQTGGTP